MRVGGEGLLSAVTQSSKAPPLLPHFLCPPTPHLSNKEMDDDIVDSFVECMLPLVVSSVFSVQCSFHPPPPRAILFLGVFELI